MAAAGQIRFNLSHAFGRKYELGYSRRVSISDYSA
jgi:hypothetical protein